MGIDSARLKSKIRLVLILMCSSPVHSIGLEISALYAGKQMRRNADLCSLYEAKCLFVVVDGVSQSVCNRTAETQYLCW